MIKKGILLLAAGAGKRFGGDKLSAVVDGQPMFIRAMDVIDAQVDVVHRIVVTGQPSILTEGKMRGWDVEELAKKIGLSRAGLYNKIKRPETFNYDEILMISKLFKVPVIFTPEGVTMGVDK